MATQRVDLSINVDMHGNAVKQVKHLESSIIRFVGAVSAALASLKLTIFPITEAARFERAMKDVQKTTNFTDEEIRRLSSSLRDMATELAVDATQLATIAATAGQLGLGDAGIQSIEAFTESVARASVTLSLVEQDAAEAGAVIANIFKIDPGNIERVFSSINELSNNSVASAKSLIDITKRMGNTADVQFSKVAALAAYIKELGVPDEQAGTFLVKAFSNMLAEGDKFAKAMGITQAEWISRVRTDAVQAFQDITKKLYEMDAGVRELSTKKLFGSGRLFSAANKVISDAATGQQKLAKFLNISNKAFVEGTSSIREYETIVSATSEQFKILKNTINELAIGLGTKLLPKLTAVIKKLRAFFDSDRATLFFEEMAKAMDGAIDAIIAFGSTVASMEVPWTNLIKIMKALTVLGIGRIILGINRALVSQARQVKALAAHYLLLATSRKKADASAIGSAATATSGAIAPLVASTQALDAAVQKVNASFLDTRRIATSTNHALEGALGVQKRRLATVVEIAKAEEARFAKEIAAQKTARSLIMEKTRLERQATVAAVGGVKNLSAADVAMWKLRNKNMEAWRVRNIALGKELTDLRIANVNKVIAAEKALGTVVAGNQASILASNTAFIAAQNKAKGLTGVLAAAPKLLKSLKTGLGVIAGWAVRAFTGWVGLAVTAVWLFWDEIKDIFSLLTKKQEDAKADAVIAQKELAKALLDAKAASQKASGGLKEASSSYKGIVDFTDLVNTESVDVVKATMKQVVDEYVKFLEIQKDASGASDSFSNAIKDENAKLEDNKAKLEAVNKQIKSLEDKSAKGSASGRVSSLDETISGDIVATMDELIRQQTDYDEQVGKSTEKLKKYKSAMAESNRTAKEAAEFAANASINVAKVYDEQVLSYIELKQQTNEFSDKLVEAEKKVRGLRSELDLIKPVGDSLGDLQAIDEANYKIEQAEKTAQGFRDELSLLASQTMVVRDNLKSQNKELVDSLDLASKDRIALLAENVETLKRLDTFTTSVTETLQQQAPKIVASYLGWKKYKETIESASAAVVAFKARVKGVLDNTGKEIAAVIAGIANFSVKLDAAIHDRDLELKFTTNYDKEVKPVLDKLDKKLKEIDDEYNPEINAAKAAGYDTTLLEALKERQVLQVKAKKASVEENAALLKANSILKDRKATFRSLLSDAKEQARIAKDTGSQDAANNALALKQEAKAILEQYKEAAIAKADLVKTDPFTGKKTRLIPDYQIKQAKNDIKNMGKDLSSAISGINQSVFDAAAKSAAPYEDAIAKANAQVNLFGGYIKQLGNTYVGFSDVVAKLNNNIDSVIPNMETLLQNVSGVASDVYAGDTTATEEKLSGIATSFGDEMKSAVETALKDAEFTDTITASVAVEVPTSYQQRLKTELEEAFNKAASSNIAFKDGIPMTIKPDMAKLQQEFSRNPITMPIKVIDAKTGKPIDLTGGTFSVVGRQENRARGGYITGPGSATSDSIPAWLSNGEYVIDAFTTGFFGSSFFKTLQNMARGGSKPKFKFPGFAAGGPVAQDSIASLLKAGGEVVTLNLNIGNSSSTLYGERRQVKDFITALQGIDKGL